MKKTARQRTLSSSLFSSFIPPPSSSSSAAFVILPAAAAQTCLFSLLQLQSRPSSAVSVLLPAVPAAAAMPFPSSFQLFQQPQQLQQPSSFQQARPPPPSAPIVRAANRLWGCGDAVVQPNRFGYALKRTEVALNRTIFSFAALIFEVSSEYISI
ncbi:hypothetical protein RIF29_38273 [Crotalaria pallida]|uniref:Uncharacterized protein n=1 Tax=Crotalaria pallida TaxID=3830 RepID=A0AAN9E0V0_CROPI